ncbi:MAG: prolipoprotein diacylglyceryl transferase [Rikenellaceae bacterium]|nr:prolipoprotein diacylglyceryl transferase [Rikenellaceae bacterium]
MLMSIYWDFDPVMLRLGENFDVRYYGLMWALAIGLAAMMFDRFVKREGLPEKVSESIFYFGTLATIIGSRVGHCLFYEPDKYLAEPLRILTDIRDGGMASHGAAIGLLIGLWLFSRRNKLPYLWSLDRIMIAVAIGGAMVRFGNLFNSEIIGAPTDAPWGFIFARLYPAGTPVEAMVARHPAQIYEALCYVVTFVVLMWLYYKRDMACRRPGLMFGVGLIGIFLTRFLIEFVKENQEAFEQSMTLNMGQWLSVPFIALAVVLIWYSLSRPEVKPAEAKSAPATPAPATKKPKAKKKKW